jgi:copper(I)-binding protein
MRIALTIAVIGLLAACSVEKAPLVATDMAIARPLPGMQMTAAYLTLTNNTTQAITITRVASPNFESVEMHESVLEDGMARMYLLEDVTILAGASIRFEPGGKHLMLLRPTGTIDSVVLEFHASEAVVLTVNVALAN